MNVVAWLFLLPALRPGRPSPARASAGLGPLMAKSGCFLFLPFPCLLSAGPGPARFIAGADNGMTAPMKKLLRKLFPVPLSNGGLFTLLLVNLMASGPLYYSYDKFATDQKDVRSFYIEGVFKRYSKGYKGDHRKLIIATGGETYPMTFWDKYSYHITREETEQYLGEVFMIEYIKGPREWFWAQNRPYTITLKDGRQILNVAREEYIGVIWNVLRIDCFKILAIPAFMLASLILTVLTMLSRLRHRGE